LIADVAGPHLYRRARKYSVTIAGHPTSIRLEPWFWERLGAAAAQGGIPVNALVARIDAERLDSASQGVAPPNLASALRLWLSANHS
jgi:predicted DNA-binding ribbon-helix-helix protein